MRRPFSVDRPCWDTLYIENFRQNSSSDAKPVFILRSHHITGDGVSNSLLLHRLADSVPVPVAATDKTKAKPIVKVVNKQGNVSITKAKFQNLMSELQNVYWAPLLLIHQVKEFNFHKDFLTKKKSSQDCTLLRTEMSLQDFKTVRREHFGDSPLGSLAVQNWIAAGTLRKLYKRELGMATLDPKSTTSASVLSSLPWTGASIKSNVSKFHNQFTVGFFKMPIHEPCRLKRKETIIQDCRNISKFRFPQVFRNVLPFYGLLPFLVVKAILGNNVGASGQLGTVVGPQRPIYLGGTRVVNLWGITGIQYPHMGMTNLQSSYDGRMTSTFLFNKDLIPSEDTAALDKDFKDEFQSILGCKSKLENN